MSGFASPAPEFQTFLSRAKHHAALAPGRAGDARNTSFVPRNFLIDERIDPVRAEGYGRSLGSELDGDLPAAFESWNAAHNAYILDRVFVKPPASHNYRSVDTADPASCPETFRSALASTAFDGTDLDTHLVRLVAVSDIAWLAGENEQRLFDLGVEALRAGRAGTPAGDALTTIFEEAFLGPKCDHRPMFAAFYEDFLEELSDLSGAWANKMRNRLGLFHFNQWAQPFPCRVFLFRYSVRELPRRRGDSERRPIALPTVLDHRLSEAFCPSPANLSRGQLVNLQEGATKEPAREVLHLYMPFELKHLFRVGVVDAEAPSYLGPARRDHLLWLRLSSNRDDYGGLTDIDLF